MVAPPPLVKWLLKFVTFSISTGFPVTLVSSQSRTTLTQVCNLAMVFCYYLRANCVHPFQMLSEAPTFSHGSKEPGQELTDALQRSMNLLHAIIYLPKPLK